MTITKRTLIIGIILAMSLLGFTSRLNTQTTDQSHRPYLAKLSLPYILSEEILLQDTFDRANANVLGAPWTEGNEQTMEYVNSKGYKVGPGYVELYNNALAFHYNNHSLKVNPDTSFNQRPYVLAPLSKPIGTYPVTLSFAFTPHPDERVHHETGLMSAADGVTQKIDTISGAEYFVPKNGLGIFLVRSSSSYNNSRVEIITYNNGVRTVLAQQNLTFQFTSGTEYIVQVTIEQDFTIKVVISSPTEFNELTYNAIPVPFSLDQFFLTDTEGGISSDTTGPADFRLFFDDILVKQTSQVIPPTPPRTEKDEKDDNDNDDDGDVSAPPSQPAEQVFNCWPWEVIVSPLAVPGAGNQCLPSLGEPLPASSSFAYLGHSTDVTVTDATGMAINQFNPPLKVCFRYTQTELDLVDREPMNFLIQTYHNGEWEQLVTTPESDPSPTVLGRVCASVDHLTLFALFDGREGVQSTEEALGSLDRVKFLPETGMRTVSSWGGLIGGLVVGVTLWVVLSRRYESASKEDDQ